jgi:DNA-binding NtrC family response regulator
LQHLERLASAAAREMVFRLGRELNTVGTPKVAEAAMEQPSGGEAAPGDLRLLEELARAVVEAALGLAGRAVDPDQLAKTVEQAARKHLMAIGADRDVQRALIARLAAEAPYLINLVRLAELVDKGIEVPPSGATCGDPALEIVGGKSKAFAVVLKDLERVAETDLPVLLLGETGTGKELMARRLHHASPRREGPFVPVNCAALPGSLLESELFGHAKGAFTGATTAKEGYLQAARGGTLFLDEIGETSSHFQVRLLRVLEDRVVTPVGSRRGQRVDFRLVTASHRDLNQAALKNKFNQALLYRILVVPLKLPPIRERREDLPALIDHFLAQACVLAKRTRRLAPETAQLLMDYHWPGNVRELSHLLQRLVVLSPEYEISPDQLPQEVRQSASKGAGFFARRLDQVEDIPKRRKEQLARILSAARGGEITNRDLRQALGCSDSTAKNFLRALVKQGILEARGRRGGRRYQVLEPEEE